MSASKLWADENSAPLGTWQHELSNMPAFPANPQAYARYDPRYMAYQRLNAKANGPYTSYPTLQQGPPPANACDEQCKATFEVEKDEIKKVYADDIQSAQAQCLAIRVLFECQCNSCGQDFRPGQMLQQDLCKPDMTSKLHEAGGPCTGFTSSFCQKPFGEEFCQQRTWMPDQGSQAWLQTHKVMDPGNTSGTAGENLFSSQLPQYSQSVADSLAKYLAAGAAEKSAESRFNNLVAEEVEALQPVRKQGGIQIFNLPLFQSTAESDKAGKCRWWHKELFGKQLSQSDAHQYGQSIKDLLKQYSKKGIVLPASLQQDLRDLEVASAKYNA
ncbi:hypothetical protein GUITHDRAFT_117586 [Guillardia theta CCMP2712]|uniref:Uncharacterized protein n=1 Tax=Guillardia theta (strain CCMP2712) TaxID=905079 RepID=L1IKA1_GUITC|nr:hypothetical protein GUITHDRAFT_117586 [Guillardia theta CCMP2712]EKX36230.1 hypothetical protein GUITHDRAFT_117586 [Guillardia theta CCMP2712]|eukprot:XP_005823210.1 hypothetical protein GUITHDRAFT_117586 [Guillardia theta CCMP2712]